ncbi:MAG TPA: molybdate ABC transporter substrate-binding protein [Stellaceae bacterium]|nr:molybdate ABC transporter substrate-binding protein [Stellaceae bacterium]
MKRRVWLAGLAAFIALAVAGTGWPSAAWAGSVVVFAAASLKNALDDINAKWLHDSGKHVVISYAASPTLAKQIENGAPADIFISADLAWMDYLQQRNLIAPASRRELLGNSLVLIAPKDRDVALTIGPGFPLRARLGGGRLAMADPRAVPAGKYGKAALEKLGVWSAVENRVAAAENVRAALLLVARGEAPLGIVYRTDAAVEPGVKIVAAFPADTLPPILYPIALTAASTNPDAAAFAAYLSGPAARPLFEKQGFTVLAEGSHGS